MPNDGSKINSATQYTYVMEVPVYINETSYAILCAL
jgi:hypothetical protein